MVSDAGARAQERPSPVPAVALETEVLALREQSLTHVKERVALKAILDDKVRALISDIGVSLSELPFEVRETPLRSPRHNHASASQGPAIDT